MSYTVKLEKFEGPLDLLLHLIKTNEIDIYDIPIAQITEQYLDYLKFMKKLNLEIAGEFLLMAATLIYIKSKMLLPQPEGEEEEEEVEDPRAELVRQLLEHKKWREVAQQLYSREVLGRDVFVNPFGAGQSEDLGEMANLVEVSLFDLVEALRETLKRARASIPQEITLDRITLQEKMAQLMERVKGEHHIILQSLFAEVVDRFELILTFLAILELIRSRMIRAFQARPFGPIHIYQAVIRNK